jgi:hypothetical protein
MIDNPQMIKDMNKYFVFELDNIKFKLNSKFLRENPNKKNFVSVNRVAAASIIKQYIKQKYPSVVVSCISDTFSGGSSVDVYISDKKGLEVTKTIEDDVRSFGRKLQAGSFNGMIDMYESDEGTLLSDNGTPIETWTKYISVQNKPKFGSREDIISSILKGEKLNRWYSESEIIKATKHLNTL